MVMKIPLQQVIEAIEMVDDAFTALWDSKTGETRKKTISDVSIDSKEKIVKLDKMTDGDIIELKLINVKSEDTIIKGITASDKFIY